MKERGWVNIATEKRKGNYKTTGLPTSDTESSEDQVQPSITDAVPPSVPSTPTNLNITDKVAESNEEIHVTNDGKNDTNANKTNDTKEKLGEFECLDMDVSNGTDESSDSPLFSLSNKKAKKKKATTKRKRKEMTIIK